MQQRCIILYDEDCGFCKWSLAKFLAWDRRQRLRPVALQDPEADLLLRGMSPAKRMDSWHLVTPDGTVHSSGAAAGPLLRLLPGGRPLAALLEAFPRTTERTYRCTVRNRDRLGRWLHITPGDSASCRIDDRNRSGPEFGA